MKHSVARRQFQGLTICRSTTFAVMHTYTLGIGVMIKNVIPYEQQHYEACDPHAYA
jgi:hypothetical protein